MITNLVAVAVITIITNVTGSDNAVWGRDWSLMYPEGGGPSRIYTPATEQYLTTNVTEHTELMVKLSDGPHTFTYDRLLSSVTAILRLKPPQWEPAGIRTNETSLRLLRGIGETNFIFVSGVTITNVVITNGSAFIKP